MTSALVHRPTTEVSVLGPSHVPLSARPFLIGWTIGSDPVPFFMTPEQRLRHMLVFGEPGSGKSKFLELYGRYLFLAGEGGMHVDPARDSVDELMAFAAYRAKLGDESLLQRIHWLELSPHRTFSLSPFADAPPRRHVLYEAWLSTKVDRIHRHLLRRIPARDQEVMRRMRKWLKNILYACGVALDDANTHIGLDKALYLTDPRRPGFRYFLDRVWPHLNDDVRADFFTLRETKSEFIRDKLESVINFLRDELSPLVKTVFGNHAPPLNVRRMITERQFLLVNLRETPYASHDQNMIIGGLLIDEVLSAKMADEGYDLVGDGGDLSEAQAPPELRVPFTLIIDEAGDLIDERIPRGIRMQRKNKLTIILGTHNPRTLSPYDPTLAEDLLTFTPNIACFRVAGRRDKQMLADRTGTGNIDFTERERIVQYHAGYDRIVENDETNGVRRGANWKREHSRRTTDTDGVHTASESSTEQRWSSDVQRAQTCRSDGSVEGTVTESSHASSGGTRRDAVGHQTSHQHSESNGVSAGQGGDISFSNEVTTRATYLARIVTCVEGTGQLVHGPVEQQYARLMQHLHTQDTAEAVFSLRGMREGVPVRIAWMEEEWRSLRAKSEAISLMKRRICSERSYVFSPVSLPQVPLLPAADNRPPRNGAPPRNGEAREQRNGHNGQHHHEPHEEENGPLL